MSVAGLTQRIQPAATVKTTRAILNRKNTQRPTFIHERNAIAFRVLWEDFCDYSLAYSAQQILIMQFSKGAEVNYGPGLSIY